MLKKAVSILAAAIAIGSAGQAVFADSVTQDQWSSSSVSQNESVNTAGPAQISQFQNNTKLSLQSQAANTGGAAQGQSISVTGGQVQAGLTSGSAHFAQSGSVGVNIGDEQVLNQKQQGQVTQINNSVSQATDTAGTSLVVQAGVNNVAASHFQIVAPSGLSIQHQSSFVFSGQFQGAITKPNTSSGIAR